MVLVISCCYRLRMNVSKGASAMQPSKQTLSILFSGLKFLVLIKISRKAANFSLCFLPCFLWSCATPTIYGPEGSTGGYTNFKLSSNTHRVVFRANGFTSNAGCENMALIRGGELTLIDGCKYFDVLQGGTQLNTETTYLPGQTNVQTNSSGQAYGNAKANAYTVGNNIYGNANGSVSCYGTSYTTITQSPPIPITISKPATFFIIKTTNQKNPGSYDAKQMAIRARLHGLVLDGRVSIQLPAPDPIISKKTQKES